MSWRPQLRPQPVREVVRLATRGGARALGLGDRIGSIEKGKLADLVLVDASGPEATPLHDVYSQLVYALKGASVRTVMVGGRVVVRDRKATTVDEAGVLARSRAIAARVR